MRPRASRTPFGAIAAVARRVSRKATPAFATYRNDPLAFVRDVLGFELTPAQARILEAIAGHDSVAVPAGRAVGKSRVDAVAALWFAVTRGHGARVILTAPTAKQVQQILWEEIRNLHFYAKIRMGGELAKLAATGARFSDGQQIFGVVAEAPEAFQGIRAPEMLVIADEASGIREDIFQAIDGNLAGCGKLLLTSNPTKASGYFREACRSERFQCIPLPSTASPNVQAGRVVVRGMATADWLEERKREWGEDSALYKIHVLGEFVEGVEGRLFSAETIAKAEARWSETPATGRLAIGIDPAGPTGMGDESAFAVRRGKKVLGITARTGLTPEAHLIEVLGIISARRLPSDALPPIVVVDRDGIVGARVYAALVAYQEHHEAEFELVGVRGSERARRRPFEVQLIRDDVWYSLEDAFKEGLAIPEDVKLARELSAIRAEKHASGRNKITGKDDLRRELGRSPDRADALALCAWTPIAMDDGSRDAANRDPSDVYQSPEAIDPYTPDALGGADPVYG